MGLVWLLASDWSVEGNIGAKLEISPPVTHTKNAWMAQQKRTRRRGNAINMKRNRRSRRSRRDDAVASKK